MEPVEYHRAKVRRDIKGLTLSASGRGRPGNVPTAICGAWRGIVEGIDARPPLPAAVDR
jgi:hypothetical protein